MWPCPWDSLPSSHLESLLPSSSSSWPPPASSLALTFSTNVSHLTFNWLWISQQFDNPVLWIPIWSTDDNFDLKRSTTSSLGWAQRSGSPPITRGNSDGANFVSTPMSHHPDVCSWISQLNFPKDTKRDYQIYFVWIYSFHMDNIPSISPTMWSNLQAPQGHPSCLSIGTYWGLWWFIASFFLMECAFDCQSRVSAGINTKNTILDCEIPFSIPCFSTQEYGTLCWKFYKIISSFQTCPFFSWLSAVPFLKTKRKVLCLDRLSIFHHPCSEWESL